MPRGAAPRGATCSGFRAAQVLRVRGGATAELAAGDEEAGDDAGVEDGGLNDGSGDEWLDEYFPEDQRKEWGWAAVRLGGVYLTFVLTPIPIFGCFMNRKGLLMANLWLTMGSVLILGPHRVSAFLTARRRQMGSAVLGVGLGLIFRGWCILGFGIQMLGLLGLLGERVLISTLRIFYPLLPSPIKRVLRALLSLCGMTPPSAVASAAAAADVAMGAGSA
eukprot:Tamp_24929.p1 GENE.Tamp_24929~~Tamp_24929.p1  ORF type:complete len:242 (+),score=34.51 Tamp_24929:69-728(+)